MEVDAGADAEVDAEVADGAVVAVASQGLHGEDCGRVHRDSGSEVQSTSSKDS